MQITCERGRVSAPPQRSPAFSPSRAPAAPTPLEERGRIKQTSCQPTRHFRGLGEITLCTDFQRKPTYHPSSPFSFPLSLLAKETNHVWCQPSRGGLTTSLPTLVTVGAQHGMQTPVVEDSARSVGRQGREAELREGPGRCWADRLPSFSSLLASSSLLSEPLFLARGLAKGPQRARGCWGKDSGILFLRLLPCFAPNSPPIMKVQPRQCYGLRACPPLGWRTRKTGPEIQRM